MYLVVKIIFGINEDKQIPNDIKHIGVPPAVRGHLPVPVSSAIVPDEAIKVTIPMKIKNRYFPFLLGIK